MKNALSRLARQWRGETRSKPACPAPREAGSVAPADPVSALIERVEASPHGRETLDARFLTIDDRVAFLYLEKVACTYIKNILVQEAFGSLEGFDPSYYLELWGKNNLIHTLAFEGLRTNGRDVLRSDRATITFCRNPYGRFLSAYFDKIVNPPEIEKPGFQWVRREILFKQVRQRNKAGVQAMAGGIRLEDFARFVAEQDEGARDKHWAHQHSLNLAHVHTANETIRIETLDETFPGLWERYMGRPLPRVAKPERNVSRKHHGLDKSIADIIYKTYERDFDLFGYARSSWQDFA
ncbi:sulfotransferase family protein [Novosphingobium sp. 1949]|uniref:Sulfotransferase family protein n=1 Tax=Novosphingobium organovorum TaxID=2930092 RepID=A0ABT0BGI7_9SPHN|nr:sulfotransferase family 2 domain-containing protein [Novosphingobium organovorum]MCJ2184177.1 sulfotransferase family protein [Novosphingobium organovorum]